jgi:anthraniloyl-CoA monooxygenase
MEDAIALADTLASNDTVTEALADYEAQRRPGVESLQRAAATSQAWFEDVDRYLDLDDEQFVFQLLTRSQRITHENLKLRDHDFTQRAVAWFREQSAPELRPADPDTAPMFYPFRLRQLRLANRVGVSPMAQYCAEDGVPTDWHLVHLGSRAVGGAGLVMTEMTCPTPDARITPGCTGLWNEQQQQSWRRIVDFVHDNSDAAIGIQLGHAGRKGSVKVPWEGDGDHTPLDEENWPLVSPSPLPWAPHNQVPREMTLEDMSRIRDDFVRSAQLAASAGFELLELHMAHGYLLSSFLSPLTNRRDDGYGGDMGGRARWPLEVFDAVRAVWPAELPMSVRISAVDWVEDGNTSDDAVAFAELLAGQGCDIIDVSTGQVHPDQSPDYGRLYQTPFSDRIRHEVGIPTMTVGAVSSVDDVNTILLAGRADIALLARPHLVDPYWTLNAAIDLGYADHPWPSQYLQGRTARRREQDPLARIVDR